MRWLWRIFILVVVLVAAVLLFLRTTAPGSTIRLAGLSAPVTIERDRYDIPTIAADNLNDALFAVGYLHAESRLFQMELTRRYGAGRLSELFGAVALPTDKYMRTLGLYRAAEAQVTALSPEARRELDAYTAGVNAWLAQRSVALPPEYYLIGARPEKWKPADTLVWGKLMALQLSGNFRDELLRARILRHIKPDELAVLFPSYPKGTPSATGETAWLKGLDLDAMYAAIPPVVGPIYESNNWVVDGAHTASGKPMLANDPHLSLTAPGVWFLLHIKTPELDVTGVTAPGNPYVVIGHNLHAAWGFTTTASDVEDLFVEKVDPKDPTHYLTPGGSQSFVTREETIGVKGAAPVKLIVRTTRHGPVISDLGGKYGETADSGTVLALQVTWAGADDHSPEALRGINFATTWTQFRDAMKSFVGPEQNMVFADDAGEIGFIAPGRIPIRAKGDGYMPVPGWSGAYDWKGYIPFDDLPQGLNPKTGRFVTANAKIVPDSYKYFISRDWDIPNRTIRINQMLDAMKDKKLTPGDFARMQADTMSLMAQDLVPLMTAIAPQDPRDRRAIERLKAWNFHMDRDLVEPTMFVAWLRALNRALFAKKLGAVFSDYWGPRPLVVHGILTQHRDWCVPDDGKAGDCAAVLAASLHSALDMLTARYGGDMSDWVWGRVHIASFPNQFWANVPVLGRVFALGIATDGGSDTVNRGDMEYARDTDPFADLHGPGLRTIVDLASPGDARFLITPGQSSNPLSAHYGNLVRSWRDFDWLYFGKTSPVATTRLLPAATANRGD